MIRPILDQFVVKEVKTKISASPLILSQKTYPTQQGEVLAVSDGYYENEETNIKTPMPIKVGDIVVFPRQSGFEMEYENEKVIMLRKEHIIGILTQ